MQALGEALGDYEEATDFAHKAACAEALADAVRAYTEDQDPDESPIGGDVAGRLQDVPHRLSQSPNVSFRRLSRNTMASAGSSFAPQSSATFQGNPKGAIATGLNVWKDLEFQWRDGFTYPTAFNAFQAQKEAIKEKRKDFTTCSWTQAATLGRNCQINVASWDAGREQLLEDILFEQAVQHDKFAAQIVCHAAYVEEDSMPLGWWRDTMPKLWKLVKQRILSANLVSESADAEENDKSNSSDDEAEQKTMKRKLSAAVTSGEKSVKKKALTHV